MARALAFAAGCALAYYATCRWRERHWWRSVQVSLEADTSVDSRDPHDPYRSS